MKPAFNFFIKSICLLFLSLNILGQTAPKHFLSFIIPCYNCASTLQESVDSIYQQDLTIPFEVICTDDGSRDETQKILFDNQAKKSNFHVYVHENNQGGAQARNTCVEHAQGDLIFCLDSDNILEKNSIPPLVEYLDATGFDGAAFMEVRLFEQGRNSWSFFYTPKDNTINLQQVLTDLNTPGCSGNYLYTKKSFYKAGGYPLNSGALDTWGFGFRQCATGSKIAILPNSFYWHRCTDKSYWKRDARNTNARFLSIVKAIPEIFSESTNQFLNSSVATSTPFDDFIQKGILKSTSHQNLEYQFKIYEYAITNPNVLVNELQNIERYTFLSQQSFLEKISSRCKTREKLRAKDAYEQLNRSVLQQNYQLTATELQQILAHLQHDEKRHTSTWHLSYEFLPELIKKYDLKVGCEVGVAFGTHSYYILANSNLKKLYSVDPYKNFPHSQYDDPMNFEQKTFDILHELVKTRLAPFAQRSSLIRALSTEAAQQFATHQLDFVYIDANHTYQATIEDLNTWFDKVRPGGIVTGDDYGHVQFPGVKKAVDEFFAAKNLIVNQSQIIPEFFWVIKK